MSTLAKLTDLPDGHEEQLRDFDKRYLQTYMLLEGKPAQYIGRDGAFIHFNLLLENTPLLWNFIEYPNLLIEPLLPKVGYYNVNGTPIYLYKNPQKQWKRSFCSTIYTHNTETGMLRTRQATERLWRSLAIEVTNPTYALLDEITKNIFAYVAINRDFAILADEASTMHLMYRQYMVGKLLFNTKEIQVIQPSLYQEIIDLFKQTGVQIWKMK